MAVDASKGLFSSPKRRNTPQKIEIFELDSDGETGERDLG
jgi:hypothetical protein